jgi:hypothetical protein
MSFVVGANLPWVRYGGDFGANAWAPAGGVAARDSSSLETVLSGLADIGVTHVRWFLLCDGRAGLQLDDARRPRGVDAAVWRDMDAALTLTARARLRLMPVLFDFHLCRPRRYVNRVQIGGRAHLLALDDHRERLLDVVVAPILGRYGRDSVIATWDLINEPEWATFGVGTWNPVCSVSRTAMRAYIRSAAALVHALTCQQVTVGSAGVATLPLVQGLGLDSYHPHWYDTVEPGSPLNRFVIQLGCDAPVVLGEFPSRGSARRVDDLLATARRHGYAGAYGWSVLADDSASDRASLEAGIRDWINEGNHDDGRRA